jgi:hypothetical protein
MFASQNYDDDSWSVWFRCISIYNKYKNLDYTKYLWMFSWVFGVALFFFPWLHMSFMFPCVQQSASIHFLFHLNFIKRPPYFLVEWYATSIKILTQYLVKIVYRYAWKILYDVYFFVWSMFYNVQLNLKSWSGLHSSL